jgi:hypothetical protein
VNGPQVLWLGLLVWLDSQPRGALFVAGFASCGIAFGLAPALAAFAARFKPHARPIVPLPPGHPFARPTPAPVPVPVPVPPPSLQLEILMGQLAAILTAVEGLKAVLTNGSTIVADLKAAEPAFAGVAKDIEAVASELSTLFASLQTGTPAAPAAPSASVPGGA